jgi:archaeosine-15-forming tRNA-guanine transglycosylase
MSETKMSYESPMQKVVVSDAAMPFVARGGRLFPGQVVVSDPGIENGEDVLVVDKKNRPLSTVQILLRRRKTF